MSTSLRWLDAAIGALAAVVLTASTLLICLNVFYRYAVLGWLRDLSETQAWADTLFQVMAPWLGTVSVTADEVPGLLLVWIAFLGAYLAMRQGQHIGFDLALEKLPESARKIVRYVVDLALVAFMTLVLLQSVRMIRVDGSTEIETASVAQGWFMLILPLSMSLMILAVAARAVARWRDEGRG